MSQRLNPNQNPMFVLDGGGGGSSSGSGFGTITALETMNYSAAVGDFVRCDPSGGDFNVTLPSAAGKGSQTVTVKIQADSGTVTILTTGGDTVDGAASGSFTLTGRNSMTFVSDNVSDWMIVG